VSEFGRREIRRGKGSVFNRETGRVSARSLAPTPGTLGLKRLRSKREEGTSSFGRGGRTYIGSCARAVVLHPHTVETVKKEHTSGTQKAKLERGLKESLL